MIFILRLVLRQASFFLKMLYFFKYLCYNIMIKYVLFRKGNIL